MKRDLKINYGILDDIINQLGIYKRSLSNMESSLSTITTYIEQNHGKSVEAWKDRMKGSREQMAEYETQINDLLNLFQGYVDDTTAYITPLQRNAMMRVDRNDIYWNLKQMESGIYNNVPKAISRTYKSPSFWGFWEDVSDSEKEASSINKSRIAGIRSDIELSKNRLNQKLDQLWEIYNSKVKKYENMDDEYNNKASVLKAKYTNFFEGFWDSLESDFNFVKDLVVGLFTGLIDIVVGLFTLVFDAGIVAVSNQIPDFIEPKFLKDAANERIDSFYTMVQQIVEDPFSVVEGIGQSFSDSVEEDGIVYVTGNFAAGFVPVVGWSKYARIGKVLDTDKPKKPVNKTANKEGKMVDPVELLLVNGKKVGIEFTSGVIHGMRLFRDILQGRNVNFAFDGGPGSVNRILNDSDDTMRRAKGETVEDKGIEKSAFTNQLDDLLISRGFTKEELEKLINYVNEEASVLKNLGLTKRELGAAVSGVYNKKTGKMYTAINNMDGELPKVLHPLIEEKIKNMPKEIREGYIKTHGAGSHAEVYAINKALLDGAEPKDIMGYVVKSGGTVKPIGDSFPMCPHCSYILKDFLIVSN